MPDKPPVFGARKATQRRGGSATKRDTSAAFKRVRDALLRQNPLCVYCFHQKRLTPATIADHIVALSLGGSNDPSNLAPACQTCNSNKAVAEQRFLQRGYNVRDILLDPDLAHWIKLARGPLD